MANANSAEESKKGKKKRTPSGLETSLQEAIRNGNFEEAKRAFYDAQNSSTGKPDKIFFAKALWTACEKDKYEIAELFLDGGVDANECIGGRKTPLMACASRRMVDLLIRHHASVDATDEWDKTALMHAKEKDVAEALIRHGATLDKEDSGGRTALWHAILLDRTVPVAHYLLSKDACVSVIDNSGRTLLSKAVERSQESLVKEILRKGASVKTTEPATGRNILHQLCDDEKLAAGLRSPTPTATSEADRKIIDLVLEKCDKEDVNARTLQKKKTPLHMAVAINNLFLVQRLLEHDPGKVDLKVVDEREKTALHIAANAERIDIATELVKHGADVNARSDRNWSPLHIAANRETNSVETVRLLINKEADITLLTRSRKSTLHVAAESGNVEVVRLLLDQNKLDPRCKDSFGDTPLLSAAKAGHKEVVKVLFEHPNAATLSSMELEASKAYTASILNFAPSPGKSWKNNKNKNIRDSRSVYTLLSGQFNVTPEPGKKSPNDTQEAGNFRWIHMPSNNVAWAQQILIRWFMEQNNPDAERFKRLHSSFNCEHVGEKWHAQYMRPTCDVFRFSGLHEPAIASKAARQRKKKVKAAKQPEASEDVQPSPDLATMNSSGPGMYLFMPYVHCELLESQKQRQQAVDSAQKGTPESGRNSSQISPSSPASARPQSQNSTSTRLQEGAERILIQSHASSSKRTLHIRRTLDQFTYRTIETHPDRDTDQVVLRYQEKRKNNRIKEDREEPRLLMVDQLMIWVISDNLILTAFPQQWGERDNEPNRHSILESIINDIQSSARSRTISDVQELAAIIVSYCSGAFDRRNTVEDEHLFLDMFDSEIGDAMNSATQLFRNFEDVSEEAADFLEIARGVPGRNRTRPKPHGHDAQASKTDKTSLEDRLRMAFSPRLTLQQKLLDNSHETQLLREVRDIRDELEILKQIFKQQETLLDEMKRGILGGLEQDKKATVTQVYISKIFEEQKKHVETPLQEIERMDKQAKRVETNLADLLEQKQKRANAIQAADNARQGLVLMVFTVVTVIFLPMSFLASIFAINIKSFPHVSEGVPEMSFKYFSKYVFGIGVAIAAFCVLLAFFAEGLHRLVKKGTWIVFKWWDDYRNSWGEKRQQSGRTTSDPRPTSSRSAAGSNSSSTISMKVLSRIRPQSSRQRDAEHGRLPT